MPRVRQNLSGGSGFNHLPSLHDQDAIADAVGRSEVMSYVDDRYFQLVAEVLKQIDDRHAERGIDHRYRLIGDTEGWGRYERTGDGRPLQLASRKLIRDAPFY